MEGCQTGSGDEKECRLTDREVDSTKNENLKECDRRGAQLFGAAIDAKRQEMECRFRQVSIQTLLLTKD